jgi:tripeptide aminopeptidase
MHDNEFQIILDKLPACREALKAVREVLLANLVMIAEVPAPTMDEEARSRFICQRFSEEGLINASSDEKFNALGIRPGTDATAGKILVVAHLDTIFPASVDHTVSVQTNSVVGPGVADNALGLAVMTSLPQILDALEIELASDLVLMGASRSLGRGNLEGLRFFLQNNTLPVCAGICVEGVQLGRLNLSTVGLLRGEIVCRVPEEYDWTRFGACGAIITLNEVLNHLLAIPLPRRPRTDIVFGSIEGGSTFNRVTLEARVRFEVRGEAGELVHAIGARIQEICEAVASETRADVTFDIVARRQPGGIDFGHPLARSTRRIMERLDIPLRTTPSTSELSSFIERKIPAITIGMTNGAALGQPNETVEIEPMLSGVAQLIGILLAVDKGYCNAD